jgi:hypothetical protein
MTGSAGSGIDRVAHSGVARIRDADLRSTSSRPRPAWPRFPVLLTTTARPGAGARRPPGLVVAHRHMDVDGDAVALHPPIGGAQLVSLSSIERAVGIEPGGLVWRTSVSTTTRPPAMASAARWTLRAGDGNRTHRGRCGTPARHLEPPASVPPSGVEPEPLGFRPSAQTRYARVGDCAARASRRHAATHFVGACQHPHRHCSSIVRDRPCAGRSSGRDASAGHAGAPVAIAIRASARSRSQIIRLSGSGRGCRRRPEAEKSARNVEGPPGIPRRPFSTDDGLHHLPGEPPREPASLPGPGRNAVPTSRARVRPLRERHGHATSIAAGGLCPWLSNTGFSGLGSRLELRCQLRCSPLANSDANRMMMRRIAVSNRSVKRFFDEIHNDAWRLAFRRSG